MILPGKVVYARGILTNLRCTKTQIQPNGIDLTLKHILTLISPGSIDSSNINRRTAISSILPFSPNPITNPTSASIEGTQIPSVHLPPGHYLLQFHELTKVLLNITGQVFPRSSLWRSGASVQAGVIDSGYEGALGALLVVGNVHGLRVFEGARLVQVVFGEVDMGEGGEGMGGGYGGIWQGSREM